jgi:hypothetical protein
MNEYQGEIDALIQDSKELEVEIGLPIGFLKRLMEEDDWSFVIKSTVLIEAAISTWLADHLQQEELKKPLSFLDIGNPKYGKLALTSSLGLTTPFDRRFLSALVELRNKLAHGIENISFSFDAYTLSLDPNQKKSFAKSISYVYISKDDCGGVLYPPVDEILTSAKETIYLGVIFFLAIVGLNIQTKRSKREIEKLRVRILEAENQLKKLDSKPLGLGGISFI